MTKELPTTLEACQAELSHIYKKKRMSNKTKLIFISMFLGFMVGVLVML